MDYMIAKECGACIMLIPASYFTATCNTFDHVLALSTLTPHFLIC